MTRSEAFIITACTRCKCFPDEMLPDFLSWASRLLKKNIESESDLFDEEVWQDLEQKNRPYFNLIRNNVSPDTPTKTSK